MVAESGNIAGKDMEREVRNEIPACLSSLATKQNKTLTQTMMTFFQQNLQRKRSILTQKTPFMLELDVIAQYEQNALAVFRAKANGDWVTPQLQKLADMFASPAQFKTLFLSKKVKHGLMNLMGFLENDALTQTWLEHVLRTNQFQM